MITIVGWRLEEEKIIISVVGEDDKRFDLDLPLSIYNEMIIEGPPSEDKRLRELIDRIHTIRKKRILTVDKILEEDEKLRKLIVAVRGDIDECSKELKGAKDKFEVNQWTAVLSCCTKKLDAITKERGILQEYRHLIKLTYQEEGKISLALHKKLKA